LTHFTAWSGNKFRVYQYDYPGSKSMKVQALIFVDEISDGDDGGGGGGDDEVYIC